MKTNLSAAPVEASYLACGRRYLQLYRETWRHGVDRDKILESKTLYSVNEDGRLYISNVACEPTGIALGHPLPSSRITRRLWLMARLFERYLATFGDPSCFAFVRPSGYHVTIANRTHFDHGTVHAMSLMEAQCAQGIIAAAGIAEIRVDLQGLLLTPDGRLLARGFPLDNELRRLRCLLTSAWPQQVEQQPELAHIKLGHLLRPLSLVQVRQVLDWLGRASHHLTTRLTFADVYMPHGRAGLMMRKADVQ